MRGLKRGPHRANVVAVGRARALVFRSGVPLRVLRGALAYAAALVALLALGLSIRGWRGWTLVLGVPFIVVVLRVWAWRRVAVILDGPTLRYEGRSPADDFEVPWDTVVAGYRDHALAGSPLVLMLAQGEERVLTDLSGRGLSTLRDHMQHTGRAFYSEAG